MRFLSVRELRNQSGKVWKTLAKDDVVVTNNGRPVGLLIGVDDASLEASVLSVKRARAQAAVSRMRRSAVEAGTSRLTARQIDAEVRRVRKRA